MKIINNNQVKKQLQNTLLRMRKFLSPTLKEATLLSGE